MPFPILAAIGLGLSAVSAGVNYANQQKQLTMQDKLNKYSMDMDKLRMEREDNAYQRLTADLQKSGLNKNLALGSGGASSQAGGSHLTAGLAPQIDTSGVIQNALIDLQMQQSKADIEKTQAETQNIRASTENIGNVLELDKATLAEKIRNNQITESQMFQSLKQKENEILLRMEELNFEKQKFNEDAELRKITRQLETTREALLQEQKRLTSSQADLHERDNRILSETTFTSQQVNSNNWIQIAVNFVDRIMNLFMGTPEKYHTK